MVDLVFEMKRICLVISKIDRQYWKKILEYRKIYNELLVDVKNVDNNLFSIFDITFIFILFIFRLPVEEAGSPSHLGQEQRKEEDEG